MTKRISLTEQAHVFIQNHLDINGIAIDATVGNGYDTLFLTKQVGPQGLIFGFDIQQQAIESTHLKLHTENALDNMTLFNTSHIHIDKIPAQHHGKVNAIMFNLGYLPNSDKTIITQSQSTLMALNKAIELLAAKGIITITAYPGHKGGAEETEHIKLWCEQLDSQYYTTHQINSSEKITAPKLFVVLKDSDPTQLG